EGSFLSTTSERRLCSAVRTGSIPGGDARWPCGSRGRATRPASAQLAVELAEVCEQQVGSVVGGPVAATVVFVPGHDGGVVAFGEAPDGAEVVGEGGKAE